MKMVISYGLNRFITEQQIDFFRLVLYYTHTHLYIYIYIYIWLRLNNRAFTPRIEYKASKNPRQQIISMLEVIHAKRKYFFYMKI